MRALLQRINRKLKKEGEMLCAARRWTPDLGNYYAVDLRGNYITAANVDPESWGREMGVLRPWEAVEQD
jgi:hypothetical protein